jgi:hypothetical protein
LHRGRKRRIKEIQICPDGDERAQGGDKRGTVPTVANSTAACLIVAFLRAVSFS